MLSDLCHKKQKFYVILFLLLFLTHLFCQLNILYLYICHHICFILFYSSLSISEKYERICTLYAQPQRFNEKIKKIAVISSRSEQAPNTKDILKKCSNSK